MSFESWRLVFFMKVKIIIIRPQHVHIFKPFEEGCEIPGLCVVDDRFPASLFLKHIGNTWWLRSSEVDFFHEKVFWFSWRSQLSNALRIRSIRSIEKKWRDFKVHIDQNWRLIKGLTFPSLFSILFYFFKKCPICV